MKGVPDSEWSEEMEVPKRSIFTSINSLVGERAPTQLEPEPEKPKSESDDEDEPEPEKPKSESDDEDEPEPEKQKSESDEDDDQWGSDTNEKMLVDVCGATASVSMPPQAPPPPPPPSPPHSKQSRRPYIRKPGRPKKIKLNSCTRCKFYAQTFTEGLEPGFIDIQFPPYTKDRFDYNLDCNRCARFFFEF